MFAPHRNKHYNIVIAYGDKIKSFRDNKNEGMFLLTITRAAVIFIALYFISTFGFTKEVRGYGGIFSDPNVPDPIEIVEAPIMKIAEYIGIPSEQVPNAISAAALSIAGIGAMAAPAANAVTVFSSLREFSLSLWNSIIYLVGFRRKKRGWGRVVEIGTEVPIPMVRVELVEAGSKTESSAGEGKVVAFAYTDSDGQYGFIAPPGRYVINAIKKSYDFSLVPDKYYQPNAVIEVKSLRESLIVPRIALVPTSESIKEKYHWVVSLAKFERFMVYVSFASLAIGTVTIIGKISRTFASSDWPIVVTYILLWVVWIYNAYAKFRYSPWGSVLDKNNSQPLSLALIRVMDDTGTRLIKTVISDKNGKFSALLSQSKYKILASKPGYSLVEPIVYNAQDKMNVLDKRILMQKTVSGRP